MKDYFLRKSLALNFQYGSLKYDVAKGIDQRTQYNRQPFCAFESVILVSSVHNKSHIRYM